MNWPVTILAILGACGLWVWTRIRLARRWRRLFASAADAAKCGDLAASEAKLREADALAARQSGVLWRARSQASEVLQAHVLFKGGHLERSAALTFDLLQRLRANP